MRSLPSRELPGVFLRPAVDPLTTQPNRAITQFYMFETASCAGIINRVNAHAKVVGSLAKGHPGRLAGVARLGCDFHCSSPTVAMNVGMSEVPPGHRR